MGWSNFSTEISAQETSAHGMISTRKNQHQGVKHRKLEHEKQSQSKKVYYKTQKRFCSYKKLEKVSPAATPEKTVTTKTKKILNLGT